MGNTNRKERRIDLAGEWGLHLGKQEEEGIVQSILLPGTLDERGASLSGIEKGTQKEMMCLTPEYHYEGCAVYEKEVELSFGEAETVIFYMERTREAKVWVNGVYAGEDRILTSPQEYDITALVCQGKNRVTVEVDNRFADMQTDAIIGSHMATAHTQTNWNGIVGRIEILIYPALFVEKIAVRPIKGEDAFTVLIDLRQNTGILQSVGLEVFLDEKEIYTDERLVIPEKERVCFRHLPEKDFLLWDEFTPVLHRLRAVLHTDVGVFEKEQTFGVRHFEIAEDRRHFQVNGNRIFVRSEANCAVFPLTGYAPMDEESWEKLLSNYQSYGINYVRFHSWCPPDAAFCAADRLGIYMQPELSEWTFETFDRDWDYAYYTNEAVRIESSYGMHPSYVALTFGNELRSHKRERMSELCRYMRRIAPDKLYAEGSNAWYGEEGVNPDSDFVMAQGNYQEKWRGAYAGNTGFINEQQPGTLMNYDAALEQIEKPAISFEVGQFQVYPDYRELSGYEGNLKPYNLQAFRSQLEKNGLKGQDGLFQRVTGRLSELCYREEIEAALRTKRLAGISLLGIQDFSGQGTALVGMMDAFGEPKSFSDPAAFKKFFNCVVPLLKIEKRVFLQGEEIKAQLAVANYGKGDLEKDIEIVVTDGENRLFGEVITGSRIAQGCVEDLKLIRFCCDSRKDCSQKLNVRIRILETEYQNDYELWVFPKTGNDLPDNPAIVTRLDEAVRERLKNGERLLFLPETSQESIPESVRGSFMSDFWCWVMFRKWDQHGTLGMLIDTAHPIFEKMSVEAHTNYQWWNLLKNSRAMIIDGMEFSPVIRMVDNVNRNHSMSLLHEVSCENGSLLICSLNIAGSIRQPETGWFLHRMLEYVRSDRKAEAAKMSFDVLQRYFPLHEELKLKAATPIASIHEDKMHAPLDDDKDYWDTEGSSPSEEKYYGVLFDEERQVDMVCLNLVIDGIYDGKAGHDLPDAITVRYLDKDEWKQVGTLYQSFITKGWENRIYFKPVRTKGIKVSLQQEQKNEVYISAMQEYENQPYAIAGIRILGSGK